MAQLLPWLRLVRAGTLFSPGCDVVAGLCIFTAHATNGDGQTTTLEAAVLTRAGAALPAAQPPDLATQIDTPTSG